MKKNGKNSEEKKAMNAVEIRELREQERMDSVYMEQPASKKALYTAINYIVALAAGAVILVALYYEDMLVSHIRPTVVLYLWMIDDSAGFLGDTVNALLNMLIFALIAVFFGFALDINYSAHGRPKEAWGEYIKYILPAAFGSCFLYAVIRHFIAGGSFNVPGSILSKCLYYFCIIAIVQAANVLMYLVLPAAINRMLLVVVSDTKKRAELPATIASALVMTFAQLGVTPNHIQLYGAGIFIFTLIQSAACSFLYHRINVIRYTILLYSGVSALYLLLAALLNFLF